MRTPKLTKLELQILEVLWSHGKAAIREIQESLPPPQPAYTTIQTTVYWLEGKKAVRRVRKIGNADIFEPVIARCGAEPTAGRDPEFLRRERAADDGAACPVREADDRRCAGVGKNDPEARTGPDGR